MKSSLSAFQKGLSELDLYIKGLDLEKQLLPPSGLPTASWASIYKIFFDHCATNRSIKKRYDYNSIIISMYGLVEQYIRALMRDYLESLQKIVPSYLDLSDKIISKHVTSSFELIKQTEQRRYRGTDTKEKIIAKLNACLSLPSSYELNSEAFCQHTANFRSDVINDFFKNIGIPNVMLKTADNLYLRSILKEIGVGELREGLDKTTNPRKKEEEATRVQDWAFSYLNDLADRRNDVAHGVDSDDLIDVRTLLGYLKFLSAFGTSIYDVLFQNLLQEEVRFHGIKVGKPIDLYKDGFVLCVLSNQVQIRKDDFIIGQNDKEYISGKVLEIQIDGANIPEVTTEKSIEIGLRTDRKFKKSHILYVVPREKKVLL